MTKTTPKRTAAKTKSKAVYVARHRQRQKRNGLRRMELAVKVKDIDTIKSVVSILRAGGPAAEQLRQKIRRNPAAAPKARTGAEFVALMQSFAPLGDDVVFTRDNISRPPVEFD